MLNNLLNKMYYILHAAFLQKQPLTFIEMLLFQYFFSALICLYEMVLS